MTIRSDTNLQTICKAHQGAHYCLFYRSEQDLIDVLAQYFKYGLENNEFCIWVAADSAIEREARNALSSLIPGMDSPGMKERIEFAHAAEWYIKGGSFRSDLVSKSWYDKLDYSLDRGYKGMRVTGDLGWYDNKVWPSLMQYEMHLNDVIPNARLSAICSYPLDRMDASGMIEVMRHHQLAIVKNNGEWQILETHKTEKPADFITEVIEGLSTETQRQGVSAMPLLYPDNCNGCGLCIDVCEADMLYLEDNKIAVRESGTCNWCTYCEVVCPDNAITCPFEIIMPGL